MDSLILRLFGSPEVIYQGQSLKFRSRKVLALLIYLVVEQGQHSREKLVALLWPESDRERGGVSLRSTVARLRQTLAMAGDFLIVEPGSLGFDFERPLDLDLHRVETAAQPETLSEAWQAALAVARGEFLEGFSLPDAPEFDDWATVQREAWHRRLESIFDRLSQQQLEQGKYAQAAETAAQWVAWASLSESAYRRLMAAHFLAGDRAAALLAFERGQSMLSQELGVEPAPETVALAKRIKVSRLTIDEVRLREPEANCKSEITRAAGPLWEGHNVHARVSASSPKLMELPLVGRADEHSQLASLYQQVGRGTTQVVAGIGEAGIGKTRLARAFVRWASLETPGADVLQGRAFEVGGRLPYQPLVEGLRARLEVENAPEDLLAD
ncbi:MAG: AAA family ATPase, partial [Chloroflexi bacterium]|nr:AAA family ATPase [Chloroflexota bacterium]